MSVTTKALIAKEDLKIHDGVNSTWTRNTSTGGTETVNPVDYIGVDVAQVYGDGSTRTDAEITAAKNAIGTNKVRLYLSPGTWVISNDVTLGNNFFLDFHPQALIQPAAGKTLTIYSPEHILASPKQQVFDITNNSTDPLLFTVGGTGYADWMVTNATPGTTDTSVGTQAILDSGISTLELLGDTYRWDSDVTVPAGVNIIGAGLSKTIIDARGTGPSLSSSAAWVRQNFLDFQISHENNTNTGDSVDAFAIKHGTKGSVIRLMIFGKADTTRHGLILYGENPDTSLTNSNQYDNIIWVWAQEYRSHLGDINGVGVYLYGVTGAGGRVNFNEIGGKVVDWATGVKIENGNGNMIRRMNFDGDHITAALHIEGDSENTRFNRVVDNYFDGNITGDLVRLEYNETTNKSHIATFMGNNGLFGADANFPTMAGTNPELVYYSFFDDQYLKRSRWKVFSKTADYGLEVYDSGYIYDNRGAVGTVVFGLPEIETDSQGLEFTFSRYANFAVRIDPDGTDKIRGGGNGEYIELASQGAYVKVVLTHGAGQWQIAEDSGVITWEGSDPSVTTLSATGPTDNKDVSGKSVLYINTASNNVTLGGLTGGVEGQELSVVIVDASNNTTLEHAEATGNQDIYLESGGDETKTATYGGWRLICDGSNWYQVK